MPKEIVVFDVNETLLDLAVLDPLFEGYLGSADLRRAWFGEMLVSAMTLNQIDRYSSFADIGRAALRTTAARAGVKLADTAIDEVLQTMRLLPPHPDVAPGLKKLSDAGLRLATLTNSPPEVAEEQLNHAGIAGYFDELITVAEAGCLKPDRRVYAAAEKRLGARPSELILVAAHTWDTAGAAHAGWQTAFIARGNQIPHPLYPQPTLTGESLLEVADAILEQRGQIQSVTANSDGS